MMAVNSNLNVIHWECDIAKLKDSTYHDITLITRDGRNRLTNELVAVIIRWKYEAFVNNKHILHYLAEDSFDVYNAKSATEFEIRKLVNDSFNKLNDEFIQRTKNEGYFLKLDINESDYNGIIRGILKSFHT